MSADGSVVINTTVDDKEAMKDLERLNREINRLEKKISDNQSLKMEIQPDVDKYEAWLDHAKEKLAQMQGGNFASDQIKEQEETVSALQARWNELQKQAESYDRNIHDATEKLESAQERAGEITQHLASGTDATRGLARATAEADKRMEEFVTRVKGLAKRVFVFSLITAALRAMRGWIGGVVEKNDEAAAAIARLKGALLTLAQPLLEVIIPAFIALVNVLTRIITVAAQLMAKIFGKSIGQTSAAAKALNGEQKALKGVGAAAKETAKNLSGLDEINTWDSGSSGGGGGSGGGISPNFDLSGMELAEDKLDSILKLVQMIGTALLAWKIGKALGLGLGKSIAMFAALYGAIEFVKGLFDAWSNGASAENVQKMLLGLAAAAVGLGIAFGPVAAGIALVVGGLAMLVTGFRDAMKNGFNLHNTLLVLAGIIGTGLGIAILTGSVIPALIAAILALLVAITVFTGHGEELLNGLKDTFGGFIDFIIGVFSGNWAKAMGGIERLFLGLKTSLSAILDGIRDFILKFLDWLDEKTDGKLHGIIVSIKEWVFSLFDVIKTTFNGWIDAIKQIFAGIVTFLRGVFTGDFDMAWEGIKQIFKGVWNSIITTLEGAVNLIIRGVNWLISQLNKIHFDVPKWVPGVGGKSIGPSIQTIGYLQIPRLAKGAVIPPNREFLAVLGDQKNGNNIETPEALLRQIIREEMPRNGGGMYQFIAQMNRRVVFDEMIEEGKLRQVRTGKNPFTAF